MKNNFCQGASCMCCCSCLASLSRNISLSDETSMLVEKKNRKGQVDMVGFSTYKPFSVPQHQFKKNSVTCCLRFLIPKNQTDAPLKTKDMQKIPYFKNTYRNDPMSTSLELN